MRVASQVTKGSLSGVFNARSIAIVGASPRPGRLGNQIVRNAKAMDFDGQIYPVNPTQTTIEGLKCYKNILDIPGRLDLVVLIVGADECVHIVREIARRWDEKGDVAGIVVVSAGFSEGGSAKGLAKEKAMLEPLQARGIRVIGPNCLGIADQYSGVNTTFDLPPYLKGGVSVVSQSGAFAASFLMWAKDLELFGLSKFLTVGNMADVDMDEVVEFLGEDENTKVIAVYMEGIRQGRRFIEVASKVSQTKPIVVFKSGRTAFGSGAVRSHTGAVAGNDKIYDGAFRQAGIIRAATVAEFYHTICALSKQPLPRGKRICVLTGIGGPGTICIDALLATGVVEMACLSDHTKTHLKEILAHTAAVDEPQGYVDMTASVTEELHEEVIKTVLADEGVDGLIYLITPPAFFSDEKLVEHILKAYNSFSKEKRKPLLNVFTFGSHVAELRRLFERGGIPTLEFPDVAASVMANMVWHSEWRKSRLDYGL
ncbi:CoA-binding protein [Pelotomaculum terephthalicicum JT]|uniref:acetate--CoA ligase family protein n=1 Tax=Pelotomaculum terephthalicicum TaxID=206393 RepID=UPI0009CAEB73|nr:CoA-binding protein [Pelotomaculum terephthalicicum]MCG9969129.1 CoA-binding protein [Pelotomaculum terephthalicicum JT]OPY62263.1 MAG: Succinyl-CoA ligase (ADP-forming) subunit alpha [Pelotomaculum sp. PtaU1.Bin065]